MLMKFYLKNKIKIAQQSIGNAIKTELRLV